jgi:BirA family biotin operon repressor/biotin-[acetyl-CoA-carboxylase] ligase
MTEQDLPPIFAYDEIDSTNAEAVRRAEAGETGPIWIFARRQTAGRGRRGRAWATGEGDLAATLLMTTDKPPGEAAQTSFVAALAVAAVVRLSELTGRIEVKWPNDVMVDDEKLAGVLIESGRHPNGLLWLAIGFGVNLTAGPKTADRPTTSFADHMKGPPPSAAVALSGLVKAFHAVVTLWETQGFAAIAKAWTNQAYGLGRPCVANLGPEIVQGVAEGLDADGALRLRLADGQIRRITAGDIFFEGL